jgi:hypothetical protein
VCATRLAACVNREQLTVCEFVCCGRILAVCRSSVVESSAVPYGLGLGECHSLLGVCMTRTPHMWQTATGTQVLSSYCVCISRSLHAPHAQQLAPGCAPSSVPSQLCPPLHAEVTVLWIVWESVSSLCHVAHCFIWCALWCVSHLLGEAVELSVGAAGCSGLFLAVVHGYVGQCGVVLAALL